jgi:hypothetical protein
MHLKPFLLIIFPFVLVSAGAQTHTSVPLESHVYHVLEQAEIRGLCSPLSGIRPYTRNVIIKAINEILAAQNESKLKETERKILEQFIEKYGRPQTGFNLKQGIYGVKTSIGKNDTLISANIGASMDIEWSGGSYSPDEQYGGREIWLRIFMNGDLGSHLSWEVNGEVGYFQAPRKYLGSYYPYYEGFTEHESFQNDPFDVYSQPLSYFPYTYQKRWDGSVHYLSSLSNFDSWPDSPAIGYSIKPEVTSSFFEDKLITRIGRLTHEWGIAPLGSSLSLNKMARPFLGLEAEFSPVSWVSLASMTGFLEFFNTEGEKASGMTFQNAYSTTILQLKYKNYLFMDIGETVIWPKRFEFGYIFPLIPSIVYKGNIGDFDNLGAFINLKAQYPRIGNIWFSLFMDEARFQKDMGELDRTMLAYQAGMNFSLPILSFSSFKVSYTKVNPYCYSHISIFVPYFRDNPIQQAYVNNGVSLGYYIPPDSDELLFSLKTMPVKNLSIHLQYQLIRHGADYGSSAVDGSSLRSELDPDGREGSNPVLKKFFLKDGAYQWMHIMKAGAEWQLPSQPITFFGEAGVNYSYFTNIAERANSGMAYPYSKIDTEEYPKSTSFIVKLGVRIFPR